MPIIAQIVQCRINHTLLMDMYQAGNKFKFRLKLLVGGSDICSVRNSKLPNEYKLKLTWGKTGSLLTAVCHSVRQEELPLCG